MRWSLILAAAAALACEATIGPELSLDMGHNCRAIDFEVRDPDVLPGWEIHAMAVERTGGARAWVLASNPEGHLMLQPWPTGPGLGLSSVGLPKEFTLMPGPIEGQAWLVLDREDHTQVWRLDDAEAGALIAGPEIPPLPGPGTWRRRLVFVDQTAYLLAVPTVADASLIEVQLAPLASDTLTPGPALTFEFWRTCPEDQEAEDTGTDTDPDPDGAEDSGDTDAGTACPTPLINGEITVEPLSSNEPGTTSVSATLIAMYGSRLSEANTAVYTTLITSLELRSAGPDQPPTMVRRDHVPWTTVGPVAVAPAQVAADANGLFVLAGLQPLLDDAPPVGFDYLIRASRSAGVQDNTIIATLPRMLRSGLLQLGARVALLQRNEDRLHIAPVEDVNVDLSLQGSLATETEAEVLHAGRGQLLVRGEKTSRRVIAGCKASEFNEE